MIPKPEPRRWRIIHSEYLARKPWYTVRHEAIEEEGTNRHIPDYYVFEYPDWVNIIAETDDGRFVFIDQYRHGLGRTDYEISAGVIEPSDASPLAAAQRELMEETGFGGGQWQEIMQICANPATTNNWTYCFLAKGVSRISDQHLDETEDIGVHLFTRDEVLELLRENRIYQALMTAPLWRCLAEGLI